MYYTYVFDIMNKQEDYSKALLMIDYLRNREEECLKDMDFLKRIKFSLSKEKKVFYEITDYETVEEYALFPLLNADDLVEYVFLVDCSHENDMVNLIYYCLVHNELGDSSSLCIKGEEIRKLEANVKDLLSELIYSEVIGKCYVWKNGKFSNLELRRASRQVKRFSPIYRIDEKEESVAYWRQSVHTFLLMLYRNVPMGAGNTKYSIDYFLPHIVPESLSDEKTKAFQREIRRSNKEYRLMQTMLECFCEKNSSKTKAFVETRYEIWRSKEFYYLIKDMPLLAMYIFCVSNYFLEKNETSHIEDLRGEIFSARDMADGVLQIIENIYHSEKKSGFFCFRVHNNSNGRSKEYLVQNYSKYIHERIEKEEVQDYLEFKIVDFSHDTIPQKFYANFVRRMESANEYDRKIYKDIQVEAEHIDVRDFFESSQFWRNYNKISENVVHHYGLQVFDSFISCYNGFFRVRSQADYFLQPNNNSYSTISSENEDDVKLGLPGTQYDIVIPFREQKTLQNIALNVNIDYSGYLAHKYNIHRTIGFTTDFCTQIYNEIQTNNPNLSYQEKKEKTIHELAQKFINDLEGVKTIQEEETEKLVIHFSADKIAPTMIEMFCKTIMLYFARKPENQSCYIMITECTQSHFIEITRMMALFYDKQGINSLMNGIQIFLSGQKPGEEFLISGCNLGEVVGSTEKLAFSRCVNPDCLKTLKLMLKNRNGGETPNEMVSIVPFDMIVYDNKKPTLFENNVKYVLQTDVQSKQFGCKIENLHVRIGSKIHIKTFYEAELLMHNNYYTSRFAYWLFGKIREDSRIDIDKPITLVGYENYSEMLLYELRNMLKQHGANVDNIIYEQKADEKFRAGKPLYEYKDTQFVVIVPINSTLTTHIKVAGFLKKSIKNEIKKYEKIEDEYDLSSVVYYGIILISSKDSNEYWKYVKGKKNTIISKINNEEMNYYLEVMSEWSNPLRCEDCFPYDDYKKEVPLIETNKESVVPMQAIGIKKDKSQCVKSNSFQVENERLYELTEFLVYKHLERKGNHFNYYFCTEKLWDFPNIRNNLQTWLKGEGNRFIDEKRKTYDIIVAPLHYSNTAFVEEVNHFLFKNVALVLHFDVDKEFRINVKSKYSAIQQLYDNLCESDEESIINFHYVDDTIISGHTFHRTKSIIRTLITTKKEAKVTINLFKTVVVLLNRLSPSSIREYIDNPQNFLAYFNLNISSMRVNSDACILCKKYEQWNKLAEQASLNEVHLYWKNKSDRIKCHSIENLKDISKILDKSIENSGYRKKWARQYMIASHKAKSILEPLCDCYDNEEIEDGIVKTLFPEKVEESLDELIAMLKVLGRPFLTFRRETKEVVFKLMLTMLEHLLQDNEPQGSEKLQILLCEIWRHPENRNKLIVILINRLTELESNYIIREKTIDRVLDYANNGYLESQPKEKKEFLSNYINRIKQLVGQSNDFAKGLFLEYLLLYGKEYNCDTNTEEMLDLSGSNSKDAFKRFTYLENTKLLNYGIKALAWNFESTSIIDESALLKELKENYYLDNFVQYLLFHKVINVDESGKNITFKTEAERDKLIGMVKLQILYSDVFDDQHEKEYASKEITDSERNLKDIFKKMLNHLMDISGAQDAEIVTPYFTSIEGVKKYIALEFGRGKIEHILGDEGELFEFIENNSSLEGNTYTTCESKGKKWIIIKFYDAAKTGNNIPQIFLLFLFDLDDSNKLIHCLKNILVFREKVWKLLNLSSSTLLQNWTDNLYYKQQMLKSKATAHAEIHPLLDQLDEVAKEVIAETEKNALIYEHFKLLVNSLIGHMNAQVLGGKVKDVANEEPCKLQVYGRAEAEQKLYQALCKVWNLDFCINKKDELAERKFRKCAAESAKIPDFSYMRILFLSTFQNAYNHGKRNEQGKIVLEVYEENENLCIANEVAFEKKERIEQNIRPEAYRSGKGISQSVIFDMCNSWYDAVDYKEMFTLKQKTGQENWKYVVKLPILEREEKNEK